MNRYESKRVFATAPDKTQIPISIVHRRDLYVVHESKSNLVRLAMLMPMMAGLQETA